MEKISVIVPVYNKAHFLHKCVDSIIKQTYQNLEIILVDDGSTDGSGQICEEYRDQDSRVRVIHQANQGAGISRNTGLSMSTGDEILFVDADDWLSEQHVEVLHNLLIKHDVDIAIGAFSVYFDQKSEFGSFYIVENQNFEKVYTADEWFQQRAAGDMYEAIFTAPWTKLFRRQVWQNVTFPRVSMDEDDYTLWKVYLQTDRIAYINQADYIRRHYPTSLSNDANPHQLYPLQPVIDRLTMLNLLGMDTKYDREDYVKRAKKLANYFNPSLEGAWQHRNLRQILDIIGKYRPDLSGQHVGE